MKTSPVRTAASRLQPPEAARLRHRLLAIALLVLSLHPLQATGAPVAPAVTAVRSWPSSDYSRITIESSLPLEYQVSLVSDPNRVVLDLANVDADSLRALFARRSFDTDPHVRSVRVGRYKNDVTRLVLDLRGQSRPTTFALKPVGQYQHRLVLDVYPVTAPVTMPSTTPADPLEELIRRDMARQDSGRARTESGSGAPDGGSPSGGSSTSAPGNPSTPAAASTPTPGPAASARASAAPPASSESATPATSPTPAGGAAAAGTPRRDMPQAAPAPGGTAASASAATPARGWLPRTVTVVVDAGHGGEDPGAHGRRGTEEKDVTLAIARRLKEAIDQQPMMRAVLTRDSDFFIPLRERVEKARRAQADLFVSIHADAFVKPDARGSSVFALSERGATSVSARWLARQENNADLIGGVSIDTRDPHLAQTLLDLSMTATITDSKRLATYVLSELQGVNALHKNYVEQAGFAVLKSPDVPSILVETAFISNPDEERRLTDTAYQTRLAGAILAGIKRYFARNPPLSRQTIATN